MSSLLLSRAKSGQRVHPRPGFLIDVDYSGKHGKAILTFLDPSNQKLFRWLDNTNHRSYLLTDAPKERVEELLGSNREYLGVGSTGKYDSINESDVELRKVFATNPLAIGGERGNVREQNFRDILEGNGHHVWEAWIPYGNTYSYDMGIELGMPYLVSSGESRRSESPVVFKRMGEIKSVLLPQGVDDSQALNHWLRLFETDIPHIRIASVDIEVYPESPNTMPNAIIASQPIICVSVVDNEGRKFVFVLLRQNLKNERFNAGAIVKYYDSEKRMIVDIFTLLKIYPMVVTFNGDNFDLMYLYNRGIRLGIPKFTIPIYVAKKTCKMTTGIHIDLYPFMKNPSIQGYAFGGEYRDFDLNTISKALLGHGKMEFEGYIGDLSYEELCKYCLNDAEITLELLTFNGNCTLNLILMLSRMANGTIYQITRNKISDWIRSTFYYLMRMRNWLIPNKEQLESTGEIQTKAKIEGKQYAGAVVKETLPGIHFTVVVMDANSLYPSEIKERNIGFDTINCKGVGHEECQNNIVPYTTHHICIKKRSIQSETIGALRDARVLWYKKKAKEEKDPMRKYFYEVLQQAIKVYLNASYGVFGSTAFALFAPPVAEAVTAFGRRDIIAIINRAEKMGLTVIAGDTDSVFLGNPPREKTRELRDWALINLKIDLDVDKVYRYAVFSHRKKNYLGIFEDGTPDIKGLTGKKSNVPDIISKPFYEVLDILGKVNTEEDYQRARREVWQRIKDAYVKIKDRKWGSMDELAFHVRLGSNVDEYETNPQHVKVAKILMEMGYEVRGGDMVHFIKATNKDGVMPVVDAEPKYVDIDTYVGQLESVMAQLIEPMQIDFKSDIEGKMLLDNFPSEDGVRKPTFLIQFLQ